MGERGEVYSDKLFTNSDRTYFFNVKENRKGDYFLNIVESKRNVNGDFERHSVFVYEENIEEFESNLLRAISVVKKKFLRIRLQEGTIIMILIDTEKGVKTAILVLTEIIVFQTNPEMRIIKILFK